VDVSLPKLAQECAFQGLEYLILNLALTRTRELMRVQRFPFDTGTTDWMMYNKHRFVYVSLMRNMAMVLQSYDQICYGFLQCRTPCGDEGPLVIWHLSCSCRRL